MARVGATLIKDPEDVLLYEVDWSAYLGETGTVLTSVWTIVPITTTGDSTLTQDNDTVLDGDQSTQVRLTGGTANRKYRIENKITISGLPAQTAERSFYLKIRER